MSALRDPSLPASPYADWHRESFVVDGHTDVPTRLWEDPADLADELGDRHVDLPRLRAGGVGATVFALYVPASFGVEEGLEHALTLHRLASEQLDDERLVGCASVAELERARRHGIPAVLFGLENGRPLAADGALETIAALGVRYVTLTHFASHEWCDASTDDPRHGGLSADGERIVRALNDRGILVDVSHVSDDAVEHAIDVSRVPVVASHSSARALCDHPRNLSDPLVRAIARSGGVVMANAYPAFLSPDAAAVNAERVAHLMPTLESLDETLLRRDPGAFGAEVRRLFAAHPLPSVPLSVYVDHLVHLVEVAGEEHVGIGTDFDGIFETPEGFEDASRFPALTAALAERGLDRAAVRQVLGGSFLALLERAEKSAR